MKINKNKQEGFMKIQQGDVILVSVEKVQGKKLNHLTLAKGEHTGHHHTITQGEAILYEKDGTLYVSALSDDVELTHQEHKTVIIPKGDWIVKRVKEYDHFLEEARNVQD